MVAFLPEDVPLADHWPDAYDEEFETRDKITFSERFPQPDDFIR